MYHSCYRLQNWLRKIFPSQMNFLLYKKLKKFSLQKIFLRCLYLSFSIQLYSSWDQDYKGSAHQNGMMRMTQPGPLSRCLLALLFWVSLSGGEPNCVCCFLFFSSLLMSVCNCIQHFLVFHCSRFISRRKSIVLNCIVL